jgi:formate dehydrogenase subunit gamma
MLIWPEASNAHNSMAAVSADGSTVCVLIRRLNSSCNRSMALVVRALFHWLRGRGSITGLNITFGKALLPLNGPDAFSAFSQYAKYTHNFVSFAFVLGLG